MKWRVRMLATAALWMMIIHFSPLANAQRDRLWPVYASNATVPTNLSTIRTFPEPPGNFNVVAATDDELAMYGFPPRPDKQTEPDHYKMWERAMSAAKIRWNGDLKAV